MDRQVVSSRDCPVIGPNKPNPIQTIVHRSRTNCFPLTLASICLRLVMQYNRYEKWDSSRFETFRALQSPNSAFSVSEVSDDRFSWGQLLSAVVTTALFLSQLRSFFPRNVVSVRTWEELAFSMVIRSMSVTGGPPLGPLCLLCPLCSTLMRSAQPSPVRASKAKACPDQRGA